MEGLPGARGKYRWRGGKIRGDPRTPFRDLRSRRRLEEMQAQSPSLGGCGMRRRAGGGGGKSGVKGRLRRLQAPSPGGVQRAE